MTLPDDKRRGTPRDRFREIIAAEKEEASAPEPRKPVVVNLPKTGAVPGEPAPPKAPEAASRPQLFGGLSSAGAGPAFWTAGAILSIFANLVLFIMLISAWRGLSALNPGGGGLLALYASLEQMDQSHIRSTIPVETTVAVDASIPVKSSTNITLARDVLIQGAHVTINTGLFNIDAPAAVTLPAGTSLDVDLDMTLPMKTSLPISVKVPVDIAIQDTELHAAIQGLKDALRPLICASTPGAMLPSGARVCH
jgi:hypothetical protein